MKRSNGSFAFVAGRYRPAALVALAVLLFAETALVAGVGVWLLIELLVDTPASYLSGLAILVMDALATVWLFLTAVNTLRGRPWVRASAVTWQVLQLAVAVGCFQGLYAEPYLGWALLVPAVLGIVLAVSPPVVRATERRASAATDE